VNFAEGQAILNHGSNGDPMAQRQIPLTGLGTVTDSYVYLHRGLTLLQNDFPSTTFTEGVNALYAMAGSSTTSGRATNGDDGYQVVMGGQVADGGRVVSQFGVDGQDADDADGTDGAWSHDDTYAERKPGTTDDGTFNIDHWTIQPENTLDDFGVCIRTGDVAGSTKKEQPIEAAVTLGNWMASATSGYTATFTSMTENTIFDAGNVQGANVEYKYSPEGNAAAGGVQTLTINVTAFEGDPAVQMLMFNPNNRDEYWAASELRTIDSTGEVTLTWGPHDADVYIRYMILVDSDDSVTFTSFTGTASVPPAAMAVTSSNFTESGAMDLMNACTAQVAQIIVLSCHLQCSRSGC